MKVETRLNPVRLFNRDIYIVHDYVLPFGMKVIFITCFVCTFFMMILPSCGRENGTDKEARMMALLNLRLTVDYPRYLNVIAFSEMDSVFGKNFFNDEEVMLILKNVEEFNLKNFNDSISSRDFDDPAFEARVKRGVDLSNTFQSIIDLNGKSSTDFTGWKMKVLYEYENDFKDTVRNEKYFIFDKTKNQIIHTFEIPIL